MHSTHKICLLVTGRLIWVPYICEYLVDGDNAGCFALKVEHDDVFKVGISGGLEPSMEGMKVRLSDRVYRERGSILVLRRCFRDEEVTLPAGASPRCSMEWSIASRVDLPCSRMLLVKAAQFRRLR